MCKEGHEGQVLSKEKCRLVHGDLNARGQRLPRGREIKLQMGKPRPWRGKWQHTPVFLPGKSHG